MYSPPGPNKSRNRYETGGQAVSQEPHSTQQDCISDPFLASGGTTDSTNVLDHNKLESPLNAHPRQDSITRRFATAHGKKRTKMPAVIESGFTASAAGKRHSTNVM